MSARRVQPAEPEGILRDLLGFDPGLVRQAYYGERSIFYNPQGAAPLGVMFASVKDRDGPNDKAAKLSRPGVYRFAFQLGEDEWRRRFGAVPPRPPKGGMVDLSGYDVTRVEELTPHPVYAWMRWAQILSPTWSQYESLRPLLADALQVVKGKWRRRQAS